MKLFGHCQIFASIMMPLLTEFGSSSTLLLVLLLLLNYYLSCPILYCPPILLLFYSSTPTPIPLLYSTLLYSTLLYSSTSTIYYYSTNGAARLDQLTVFAHLH